MEYNNIIEQLKSPFTELVLSEYMSIVYLFYMIISVRIFDHVCNLYQDKAGSISMRFINEN